MQFQDQTKASSLEGTKSSVEGYLKSSVRYMRLFDLTHELNNFIDFLSLNSPSSQFNAVEYFQL